MDWKKMNPPKINPFIVAALVIAAAAGLRVWPLQMLGSTLVWLTFYPAVMAVAIYGGLSAGLLATALACLMAVFLWPLLVAQPFISKPADWLGLTVFVLTGAMISGVAEATRRANARAKQAQELAEASNKAKSVFLSTMSHELRTPLNAILGFSDLMLQDPGITDRQRKKLDIINRSGEHLLNLVNDVLDMAKVEAGQLSVDVAPVDLGGLVRDVTDLMRIRTEEKGLYLHLDQSSNFPRVVRADAAKLRQVLINIIGNAIKFTLQGGVTLRLNALPFDQRLVLHIEVEDTGIGIADGDRERIFDPFVQAGPQTLQKGSGLGLAITRKFVELMHGRITVDSTQQQGSLFRIEVPVDRAEETEIQGVGVRHGRVIGIAPGQPVYRILIVEDEIDNWLLLQRMLEYAGFQVRIANDGVKGIALFQEWQPHFIWMDIRMAGMDGLEATRRIRALDNGKQVKIVALTASVFQEERDRVMAAGMDDFIRKPYRPEEIFDCMTRLLDIRLMYEADRVDSENAPLPHLQSSDLATVPAELREELSNALVSLDPMRIRGVLQRVASLDRNLGSVLAQHADRLEYTKILQALKADGVTFKRAIR